MFFKLLCLSNNIKNILNSITGEQNEIKNFKSELYNLYKKYKLKKISLYSLRALQTLAGIGITTMTTVNNPYFKDNVNQINIIVWYISISNNLINLSLEKMQKYNIADDKLKIKLLIGEAKKYLDNYKDYSLYDDDIKKLKYFEKCYNEILGKTPYEYLLYQGRRPSHVDLNVKQKRLNINKAWEGNDDIQSIVVDDL